MSVTEFFSRQVGTCLALVLILGVLGAAFALGAFELLEGVPLGGAAWPEVMPMLSSEGDPTEKLVLLIFVASLVPLLWQCGAYAASRIATAPPRAPRESANVCV